MGFVDALANPWLLDLWCRIIGSEVCPPFASNGVVAVIVDDFFREILTKSKYRDLVDTSFHAFSIPWITRPNTSPCLLHGSGLKADTKNNETTQWVAVCSAYARKQSIAVSVNLIGLHHAWRLVSSIIPQLFT